MNKTSLTGFLAGGALVLAVWFIFFNGPDDNKPKDPLNPHPISVDAEEKAALEADTADMVSDLHDDTADGSKPEITFPILDERPGPPKAPEAERVLEESGSDAQAQSLAKGAAADDSIRSPDNPEKAVFRPGFSSRPKALKFARYVSSALKVPCEVEKTEQGYQVFFRYSDPADQDRKMALLKKAGFLK